MATRRAAVQMRIGYGVGPTAQSLERYLPSNYKIVSDHVDDSGDNKWVDFIIEGEDVAGRTLDGYVIPRLASGLIFAEEIK